MRSHFTILKDAGGPHAVAQLISEKSGEALATVQSRVRGWSLSDSIPGEYWPVLEDLKVAALAELAGAAEARKLPDIAAQREAAA